MQAVEWDFHNIDFAHNNYLTMQDNDNDKDKDKDITIFLRIFIFINSKIIFWHIYV